MHRGLLRLYCYLPVFFISELFNQADLLQTNQASKVEAVKLGKADPKLLNESSEPELEFVRSVAVWLQMGFLLRRNVQRIDSIVQIEGIKRQWRRIASEEYQRNAVGIGSFHFEVAQFLETVVKTENAPEELNSILMNHFDSFESLRTQCWNELNAYSPEIGKLAARIYDEKGQSFWSTQIDGDPWDWEKILPSFIQGQFESQMSSPDLNRELQRDINAILDGQEIWYKPLWQLPGDQLWYLGLFSDFLNYLESESTMKAMLEGWPSKLQQSFEPFFQPPDIPPNPTIELSPEQVAREDSLDRQTLVNALGNYIADDANTEALTLGLLGHWGVGKTSVLKLLKERLQKEHDDQNFIFGEFNAWAYEYTDNIQAGLAQEVLNALSEPTFKPVNHLTGLERHNSDAENTQRRIRWWFYRPWLSAKMALQTHPWQFIFVALVTLSGASILAVDEWRDYLTMIGKDHYGPWVAALIGLGIFWINLRKLGIFALAKELRSYLKLPSYAKHIGELPVMRDQIEKLCALRLQPDHLDPKKRSKMVLYII